MGRTKRKTKSDADVDPRRTRKAKRAAKREHRREAAANRIRSAIRLMRESGELDEDEPGAFEDIECAECGEEVREDCARVCDRCNRSFCEKCCASPLCDECDQYIDSQD